MPEERTYKITCDECGYSEEVPSSRLAYEEGKTCPSCRKGKMWWVPPAEEARRREVRRMMAMPEEKRISPAVVIVGGIGLGLAAVVGLYALSRAWAAPPEEEIEQAKFYMPSEMEVLESGPENGLYTVTFSLKITNKGNVAGRHGLTWGSNYLGPEYEEEGSRIIELGPGESYTWSWSYTEVFDYYRGYFTCWLFGDWEADNSSVGVWQ